MHNITSLSDTLFRELNQPISLSISSIAYWLRYVGLGKLNIAIDTSLEIDNLLECEFTDEQAAILSEFYYIYYFDKLIFNSLGANSYDTIDNQWISLKEGDTTISRVNFIDKARIYRDMQKEHKSKLDMLVAQYRANNAYPKDERYTIY